MKRELREWGTLYLPLCNLFSRNFGTCDRLLLHPPHSLDIVFIVVVTYYWHKPLQPRKLMEVLHGINIRVCTTWWGLVWVMVAQTETPSKEPLDQCQLRSLLIWVCVHAHGHGKWIEGVPFPLFRFLDRVAHQVFRVLFVPKCTLTGLLSVSVLRTTRIAELMPTPAVVTHVSKCDHV